MTTLQFTFKISRVRLVMSQKGAGLSWGLTFWLIFLTDTIKLNEWMKMVIFYERIQCMLLYLHGHIREQDSGWNVFSEVCGDVTHCWCVSNTLDQCGPGSSSGPFNNTALCKKTFTSYWLLVILGFRQLILSPPASFWIRLMAKSPNMSYWINVLNTRISLKDFCPEQMRLQAEVKVDTNRGSYVLPSPTVTQEMSHPATSRQNPQPI